MPRYRNFGPYKLQLNLQILNLVTMNRAALTRGNLIIQRPSAEQPKKSLTESRDPRNRQEPRRKS